MSRASKAAATENIMSRIVARASKEGGEGLRRLGDKPLQEIEVLSTGSLGLDMALGVGGFPRGRIIEVYGAEAVGKTTLILHAIATAQKAGLSVVFIDAEHALDKNYAAHLGVDTDNLYVSQPMTGEEALDQACNLVDAALEEKRELEAAAEKKAPDYTGMLGLIIVDSVAALTPKAELEGDMDQARVGEQARMIGKAMRKMTGAANLAGVTVVFINQQRMKIGVSYGSPWTTTGGNALKFFASVRIQLTNIGQIKAGEEKVGNRVKANIVKNKVAPPFIEVEYDVMKGEGIDRAGEVIDLCVEHGILKAKGAWLYYGEKSVGQGRPQAKANLRANPALMAELETKVRESVKQHGLKGPKRSKKDAAAEAAVETE